MSKENLFSFYNIGFFGMYLAAAVMMLYGMLSDINGLTDWLKGMSPAVWFFLGTLTMCNLFMLENEQLKKKVKFLESNPKN